MPIANDLRPADTRKAIVVKLPDEVSHQLTVAAAAVGISKTEMAVIAITRWVGGLPVVRAMKTPDKRMEAL